MSPGTALVLTYVAAGIVIALYVWFVVWRVRVDRRKKAVDDDTATKMNAAIDRAALLVKEMQQPSPGGPPPTPTPSAVPTAEPTLGAPLPPLSGMLTSSKTVAGVLSGIALPNDLVPLSTLADRSGVGDRVAFWTDTAPVEIVGPAFRDELERLGFSVTALDQHTLAGQRHDDQIIIVVHPDGPAAIVGDKPGFPSVPERSVVIEVWIAG